MKIFKITSLLAAFIIIVMQFALFSLFPISSVANAQQKAIEGFSFNNESPAWEKDQGPKVVIHRAVSPYAQRGSFDPFKILSQTDGLTLNYLDKGIDKAILSDTKILVIPNAYTENYRQFSTLEAPSVYTAEEISMIKNWVEEGGSLLVLADHSPFAGGTIKLSSAFGVSYMTGHTLNKASISSRINVNIDFSRDNGLLADHPITNGATGRKKISHYYAFGGQAIIAPKGAISILTTPDHFETMLAISVSREFYSAIRLPTGGQSQGAAMEFGKGRVVFMGETGGFTAQLIAGSRPFGFENPEADENKEFILATMRWLARYQP